MHYYQRKFHDFNNYISCNGKRELPPIMPYVNIRQSKFGTKMETRKAPEPTMAPPIVTARQQHQLTRALTAGPTITTLIEKVCEKNYICL